MLCDAFISVLRSARNDFNALFAEARRTHPALDGQEFSAFVQDSMDPLVRAIEAVRPDAVFEVICAAWEVALELVAQRLAGPQARQPWIAQTWQQVLVGAAPLVAESPRRLIGALSNAAHQMGTTAGARPQQWIDLVTRLTGLTSDVDFLLKAGQVAAWRSGLAHYRMGALDAAASLPDTVALAALDAAEQAWPELQERLFEDPWHLPGAAQHAVVRAGAFRGFGGLFGQPPVVSTALGHLLVQSGEEGWVLTADAFGATFHRATPDEIAAAQAEEVRLPAGVKVPKDIGAVTSTVRINDTLAVTGSLTHAVLLFPLAPSSPS